MVIKFDELQRPRIVKVGGAKKVYIRRGPCVYVFNTTSKGRVPTPKDIRENIIWSEGGSPPDPPPAEAKMALRQARAVAGKDYKKDQQKTL